MSSPGGAGDFVTVSGIAVPPAGADRLEQAMATRIGLVENELGFRSLQVWRPVRPGDPYRMVTWWQDEHAFQAYLRGDAHAASHARIPTGPHRPRPAGLDRFWCIAE